MTSTRQRRCARLIKFAMALACILRDMKLTLYRRMQRALTLIEAQLGGALTLPQVAAAAHLSPFHFARLFRAVTGDSVMNYVRRRRLTEAVLLLRDRTDCSVLDIALMCGFGSNEAFTRAFRKQHGVAPATYRRNALLLHLPLQRRFEMSDVAPVAVVPRFESLPAFLAIGCAGEFHPHATQAIGQLWGRFAPRMHEVRNRTGNATYGICCPPEDGQRDSDHFTYVAAVGVSSLENIPDGMTGVEMPAREYAVFAYDGGIGPRLPQTLQYIFGEWLPNSGYELAGADFEYYDNRFDPVSGQGTFFIYVPVTRKG